MSKNGEQSFEQNEQTMEVGLHFAGTYPGEAEAVDSVCEHVAEEGGVGVQGGEVGVHVGTLPVGHLQSHEVVPLRRRSMFAYLDCLIKIYGANSDVKYCVVH
jgi:hypothetical protein